MKKIIFALCLVWSSLSFAGISGQWQGWGNWTYDGAGAHCDPMTLKFDETKNKLIRAGGFFDCQVAGMEVLPVEFVKDGMNLLQDNKIVGSIIDNSIHYSEQYDENVRVETDIKMEASHFDYKEIWYLKDNSVLYTITGRFFKKFLY